MTTAWDAWKRAALGAEGVYAVSGSDQTIGPWRRWGECCRETLGGLFAACGGWGPKPKPSEGKSYRRVAFLLPDSFDEMWFDLPALRAARRVFPNARLTAWVDAWAEDWVRSLPGMDEVVPLRPSGAASAGGDLRVDWAALPDRLRGGGYDLVVCFRGGSEAARAMFRSGIPERVGSSGRGGGYLLTASVKPDSLRHEAEEALEILRLFDPALTDYAMPSIPASPEALDRIESLYHLSGWAWVTRPIILQFAGGTPGGEWGDDRFRETMRRLTDRGHKVALVGSERDRPRGDRLALGFDGKVVNWCGRLRFSDLPALFGKALLHIGQESGWSHMALAMRTPAVVLFGPSVDPGRKGPWIRGRDLRVRLFWGPAPYPLFGETERPPRAEGDLRALPVGKVVRAAREFLNRAAAPAD